MVFRPQEYFRPASLGEAVTILDGHGERAKILAGGTAFYELAKRGMIPNVDRIVDISKLDLSYVREDEQTVRIGSTTTLAELGESSIMERPYLGALRDALENFTPAQIKNAATVGGEICAGVPFLDLPPVLLSLNSRVVVLGPKGERVIPLESFFIDYFLQDLRRGEFVKEIQIPKPADSTGSGFANLKRNAVDLAVLNASSMVTLEGSHRCVTCAIGLGGMARIPIRARQAEQVFVGKEIDDPTINDALRSLAELKPPSAIHAPPDYKRRVIRVLVRDTLRRALERAGGRPI